MQRLPAEVGMGLKDGTPGRRVEVGKFLCTHCQDGKHENCIDLLRAKVSLGRICQCPKHKTPSSS